MTTTALPTEAGADRVSGSDPPDFSSVMIKVLTAWIVIVAVLSFVTAPWLAPGNSGDLTAPLIWFYHALMLPAALLFLILCTRVFVLHPWVRYIVTHSALVAIFEGIGFLILGYGTLHNVVSLTTFGFWVILPATLELTAATLLFVIDLAYAALVPPRGQPVSPQKAEITWVFFFTGVSVITWVVFGLAAAASQVGISWSFWAGAQHESTSTLIGNIITSHSHGMLPSFMAAIVILAAEAFGYSRLVGVRKQVARIGAGTMLGGIALYSGIYTIAGIGTFSIPAWFPSGPGGVNGIAMDDTMTGLVGIGALILAAAMLPELKGSFLRLSRTAVQRFNPVRLGVYLTYLMATAAMFIYGFSIEMNESQFGFATTSTASHVINDQIFTRSHLLFVFGSLPIIAVFLLAAELAGNVSKVGVALKQWMAGLVIVGMVVTLIGMGTWVFSTAGNQANWAPGSIGQILYILGQALILVGAVIELFIPPSLTAVEDTDAERRAGALALARLAVGEGTATSPAGPDGGHPIPIRT